MNSWFTEGLMHWNAFENNRLMPWKGEKDPYKIWLSEIILQQTRVEQGISYYNAFITKYPAVADLAAAPDQEVFKLWEGLGYYSRCRNLLKAARSIVEELDGRFPRTYDEIIKLKGVGPYTAAAILSFAFDLPHAVVDGNVFRVLARVFGIYLPYDQPEGKKHFAAVAGQLLDPSSPSTYNQAIMDFGATICKPKSPECPRCPFQTKCHAFLHGKIELLPVKSKKIIIKYRWFYYLVIESDNQYLVKERTGSDIWQHLYEFYLIEAAGSLDENEVLGLSGKAGIKKKDILKTEVSGEYKQQLTHQQIRGRFLHVVLKSGIRVPDGYRWIAREDWKLLPFPRYILSYLKEKR
jgi:A/G-specific adenine glycosylase